VAAGDVVAGDVVAGDVVAGGVEAGAVTSMSSRSDSSTGGGSDPAILDVDTGRPRFGNYGPSDAARNGWITGMGSRR
jgi:hypothetical protein